MRLTLSKSDHMNADISDEQSNILYKISTSSALFSKTVTTITKYFPDDNTRGPETMGIIEWPRIFDKGLFRFNGQTIPMDKMFERHTWESGLYFKGSDQKKYKWKQSPRLWMKRAESSEELVRYHRKNLGISKPIHSAYLDISPKVVFMLDLIVLTFVYVEELRKRRQATGPANSAGAGAGAIAGCPSC